MESAWVRRDNRTREIDAIDARRSANQIEYNRLADIQLRVAADLVSAGLQAEIAGVSTPIQGFQGAFDSRELAARDGIALSFALQRFFGDSHERGGAIFKTANGKFNYGAFTTGGKPSRDITYYNRDGTSKRLEANQPVGLISAPSDAVGVFHIHPAGESGDSDFSPDDVRTMRGIARRGERSDGFKFFLGGNDGSFDVATISGNSLVRATIEGRDYFEKP